LNSFLNNNFEHFNRVNFSTVPNDILMNRVERKYIITTNVLPHLINDLQRKYNALEINSAIINKYQNLYYDTSNFDFYLNHHNDIFDRYKIRKRYYPTTNTTFLEIKKKENTGRTVKNRLQINSFQENLNNEEKKFILKNIPSLDGEIIANVSISYQRLSLINLEYTERLSFDFNIEFSFNHHLISLNDVVIAESKQSKKFNSQFIETAKNHSIKNTSFSKYCTAISKLVPGIKSNNFLPQLNTLSHYFYDHALHAVTT
jgi:hypothetical protein